MRQLSVFTRVLLAISFSIINQSASSSVINGFQSVDAGYKNISQYFIIPLEGLEAVLNGNRQFSTQTSNGHLVLMDMTKNGDSYSAARQKRQFGSLLQNVFQNEGHVPNEHGLVSRKIRKLRKKTKTVTRNSDDGLQIQEVKQEVQMQRTNMPGHVTILEQLELDSIETSTAAVMERSRKQLTRYRFSSEKLRSRRPELGSINVPMISFKVLRNAGSKSSQLLSDIPVKYRGIWILHLQKQRSPPSTPDRRWERSNSLDSTYLFVGTKQCTFQIPKEQFVGSEMVLRNVGKKHNWMSDPMVVFYSEPMYHGKSVTIRFFKDGTWTKVTKPASDKDNFYPRSSIVVNSNWNIETPVDSFCLIAQDDVTFIPDWEVAHYVHEGTDHKQFPTVSPGCPSRPHQVLQYPEPGWAGRDFCYISSSS